MQLLGRGLVYIRRSTKGPAMTTVTRDSRDTTSLGGQVLRPLAKVSAKVGFCFPGHAQRGGAIYTWTIILPRLGHWDLAIRID
ncbi:hypothetical protein JTE90_011074 [Oedothorax gibbosus]|uniref:Uncharacterized protein n=1 Tax=Oedothorax gibbosus TaxID=931172 RepID=A0AAV6UKK4_9ARAC|nr:hypothetical protein JTE90_011074 [Oedothorax gibbosus]